MIWGKYFWTTMHVVALGFPEVATDLTRQQYRSFYRDLGDVLPCSKCRGNYARHFQELPVDLYLYDKNTLFTWTVELHNIVNSETGKNKWTVHEAKEYYTLGKYDDRGKKQNRHDKLNNVLILLNSVLMVILVLVLLFMLLRKRGS